VSGAFLACDWGTTQVRAWVVDADGAASATKTFPLGVSRLGPGEAAARFQDTIRPALGAEALPAVLCGMIGSNLGWMPVPYLDCPADMTTFAAALHRVSDIDPPAWIAPGLRGPGPTAAPDVMRGEETQVFGWLAQDPARARGTYLLCLPGTHAKWVLIEDGRVIRFVTVMTGELFDLLTHHGVLRTETTVDDAPAFLKGVEAAGDGGGLGARLFSARSRVVGGDAPAAETASYLSGLLIGAEIAGMRPLLGVQPAGPVALIGEPVLCDWYLKAFAYRGLAAMAYDGGAAALSGLTALNAQRNDQ
jgi:2-dehydro-3-deoxygalactonokinase